MQLGGMPRQLGAPITIQAWPGARGPAHPPSTWMPQLTCMLALLVVGPPYPVPHPQHPLLSAAGGDLCLAAHAASDGPAGGGGHLESLSLAPELAHRLVVAAAATCRA